MSHAFAPARRAERRLVERLPVAAIETTEETRCYLVRIRGELDLAGCPNLERVLTDAERSRADRVLIDIEELEFLDLSGLWALVRASRRSATNGDRLQITRGTGQVATLFRITELAKELPLTEPRRPDFNGADCRD